MPLWKFQFSLMFRKKKLDRNWIGDENFTQKWNCLKQNEFYLGADFFFLLRCSHYFHAFPHVKIGWHKITFWNFIELNHFVFPIPNAKMKRKKWMGYRVITTKWTYMKFKYIKIVAAVAAVTTTLSEFYCSSFSSFVRLVVCPFDQILCTYFAWHMRSLGDV